MKLHKFALLVAVAASFILGACTTNTETARQKSTVLGIVTFEPGSYELNDGLSSQVRTDDVIGMDLPSGDRLSLLWGLIRFEDY